MNGDVIRRCLIFFSTVFVHMNDTCIVGLCEPVSQHVQLVSADRASLIFTVAVGLAIYEADLWPRRWPFRPMPNNLIFLAELLIALCINNVMLRIFWLPLVHIGIRYFNCTISDVMMKVSSLFSPRNKLVVQYATWLCSPGGVNTTAFFISLGIIGRIIYVMYGKRLKCLYDALIRCACVPAGPPPEMKGPRNGRPRPPRVTFSQPLVRRSHVMESGDEEDSVDWVEGVRRSHRRNSRLDTIRSESVKDNQDSD